MESKETVKAIPPYLSYKTLSNFLDSLKIAVPSRIDRSLMRSMSGTLQKQLVASLEYLGLITAGKGTPTESLTKLVHAQGTERQRLLKEILTVSYPFLFKDGFDLERTTSSELQTRFAEAGTTGDTTRKCIAFFLKAAKDAGMKISPHIHKSPGRPPGPSFGPGKLKRKIIPPSDNPIDDQGGQISWEELLISKFPEFDPGWPNDVKSKWFDDFKELMQLKKQ